MSRIADWGASLSGGEVSRAAVERTPAQTVRTPQSSKLIISRLLYNGPKLISGSEASDDD